MPQARKESGRNTEVEIQQYKKGHGNWDTFLSCSDGIIRTRITDNAVEVYFGLAPPDRAAASWLDHAHCHT